MSNKHQVITYRLNNSANPKIVLDKLEELFIKYDLQYSDFLFSLKVDIIEFQHEGKLHSNRNKNAILTILKRHPDLSELYRSVRIENEQGQPSEEVIIANFCDEDYKIIGNADYSLIGEIIKEIPKPYGVNDLELIISGIGFSESGSLGEKIKPSKSGFGSPGGSYILFKREKHGAEKHSYVCFSNDINSDSKMKSLYFEFAEAIAGKYEGTELVD